MDIDIGKWGVQDPNHLHEAFLLAKEMIRGQANWPKDEDIRVDVCNGKQQAKTLTDI